jgi:hypothetical protein
MDNFYRGSAAGRHFSRFLGSHGQVLDEDPAESKSQCLTPVYIEGEELESI